MNYITKFLWWSAGANIEVLEKCPTEHPKYFGVGGTIVFTALMASFAGGYAFFTAFKSPLLSVFFGIFWGLLIFNLDRYIVSTIGKGDGTQKITLEEWKIAAPRLIMAILLGFVIATPLELKIFEKEIQTVVERLKIDKSVELQNRDTTFIKEFEDLKSTQTKLASDIIELTNNKKGIATGEGEFFEERLNELQNDYQQKKSEINFVQKKINNLQSQYRAAQNDSLSTREIRKRRNKRDAQVSIRKKLRKDSKGIENEISSLKNNKGNAIQAEKQRIEKKIAQMEGERESINQRITRMTLMMDAKRNNYDNKSENYDGFAAHLEAMSILTEEKSAIFYAKWLITLLFIFIEIAPVLFKLMAEAGPYDDIMDRIKHESFVREKQKISDINDEINTSIKISTSKNQARLDTELNANKALFEKIAMIQTEIAEKAIEKWKEEELKKLEIGVNHIVNSNGNGRATVHNPAS
jgi:hypothetical protein